MANCKACGAVLSDGEKFCGGCGAPVAAEDKVSATFNQLNNTADTTAEYTPEDITTNKAMAILSYFGPLVLIPMFASKDSKFARFHSNQGLVLLLVDIAYGIVNTILSTIFYAISFSFGAIMGTILGLVWIVIGVLAIIGIINAANGKAKELPIIGKIKILK